MLVICITRTQSLNRQLGIFKFLKDLTREMDKKGIECNLYMCDDFIKKNHSRIQANGYDPNYWAKHLENCKGIFLLNYLTSKVKGAEAQSMKNYIKREYIRSLNDLTVSNLWPHRILSFAEHDVLAKHYISLNVAKNSAHPTLILEDDARIESKHIKILADRLEYALYKSKTNLYFYEDYCNYSTYHDLKYQSTVKGSTVSFIESYPVSTRTLCSYLVSPEAAKQITKNFLPYALPADFHMQHILNRLINITGTLSFPGLFNNGSISGKFNSQIQQ